ncbi:MAG: hypothetical protein BM556_05155 [Bacteriovorax sp. MedPE-SWde]|nr:MAG: hypothetical protein BM556_05155 [Bacteriovorax sp. MedPE-SWde]
MNYIKYLVIFFCVNQAVLSGPAQGSKYWLGESDFEEYSGPLDPKLDVEFRKGGVQFSDKRYQSRYPMENISSSVFDLTTYYEDFIRPSFQCSQLDFIESAEYIHYLHRLTAISLNYEFARKLHIALYQLGEMEDTCSIDYDNLFKKCRPKSNDMLLFQNRVQDLFPDIIDWGRFPLLRRNGNLYNLKKYHGDSMSIVDRHFRDDNLEVSLQRSCEYIKKEIISLCSEEDSYFGISQIGDIHDFILSSSAFKVANTTGSGPACMNQFIVLNKLKESIKPVTMKILKLNSDEEKGRVFWYGSLREFDELGVTIIEEEVEVEVEAPVVAKAVVKKKGPAIVAPPVKKIIKKKVVRRVVPKKVKKKKRISALEKAITEHLKTKTLTEVHMTHLKGDFKYSKKILKMLNGPLRPYQTRKALTDMKKVDKLGSKEKPLSFLFLKFLIDHKLHQGLYNIKGIIGDELYVVNDIEKRKGAIKIRLDNNKETKFKWQIWIKEVIR